MLLLGLIAILSHSEEAEIVCHLSDVNYQPPVHTNKIVCRGHRSTISSITCTCRKSTPSVSSRWLLFDPNVSHLDLGVRANPSNS
ncbi:hypothetical protein F4779DRAFT_597539 [Xylariaceae sp. FL0662B]|nr:hypothetical protein F4779DRAFT_597539 [Xylariaceae sp. FL0662B]